MQFSILKKFIKYSRSKNGEELVTINKELFFKIVISAVKSKNFFDKSYYELRYPDVLDGIMNKVVATSKDHYYSTGYIENRVPSKIIVDEKYYIENNKDVEKAIKSGEISSAQEHFEVAGFIEGRKPYQDFGLF